MQKLFTILPLCLITFTISACEMYSESTMTDRKVQVREEKLTQEVPVRDAGEDYVAGVARDYTSSGSGPVELTITYDPESKSNTAMHANNEAARLVKALHKEGVNDVVTNVLPVRDQGSESIAVISYSSYQAAAPANCTEMTGYNERVLEYDPNYKLGCTVESVFAKQIADPSDLLGEAELPTYSRGRAAANVVEVDSIGAPKEGISGRGASK